MLCSLRRPFSVAGKLMWRRDFCHAVKHRPVVQQMESELYEEDVR